METLQKIRPTRSCDIVGNRLVVKRFYDHTRTGSEPRVLALVGPTGCGKSLLCSLVFSELGMKRIDVDKNTVLKDTLSCLRGVVMVLEDTDVLTTTERNQAYSQVRSVLPLLSRSASYVVITCRPCEQKALSARFKGSIEVFSLSYPSTKDAFVYLSERSLCGDEELLALVKAYRGNIREIVMNVGQAPRETCLVVKDRGFKEYNNFDIVSSFLVSPSWELVEKAQADPEFVSITVYENLLEEAHCRDPSSVLETYALANRYILHPKVEVRLGGMCVALQNIGRVAGHAGRLRFPKALSRREKPPRSDIPLMDIVDLVDCGKMEIA